MKFDLLTAQASSPKLAHSMAAEYLSAVLYLAPSTLSGRNLCPNASAGCIAACLNLAGRGGIMKAGQASNPIQDARIRRSKAFTADPSAFLERLALDIGKLQRAAEAQGKRAAVRLNGTSDLPWESVRGVDGRTLFERFPTVQFYDYTKDRKRIKLFLIKLLPPNYSLTYSRSENSIDGVDVALTLLRGGTVSVVYRGTLEAARRMVAERFKVDPARIVDGDSTDYRFLDPRGSVNLLRAKGPAARDTSGFVLDA